MDCGFTERARSHGTCNVKITDVGHVIYYLPFNAHRMGLLRPNEINTATPFKKKKTKLRGVGCGGCGDASYQVKSLA